MTVQPLLLDGQWAAGQGAPLTVMDKFRLEPGAQVATPDEGQARRAVDAAHAAFRRGAPGAFERGAILERAAALVEQRQDAFVSAMQMEAGFTATDAGGEVRRCVQTLKLSAEEARRLAG
jgi:succinate-semialdehyde dehydrogenase/glutarate-semialdehyde dehydrogenase